MIRPVVYSDLSVIHSLERVCFAVPWSEDDIIFFYEESLSEDSSLSSSLFLCAADTSGEILGYICTRRVLDEGEVLNVASAPSARRKGVGRMLMRAALDAMFSSGAESVYLEVRESNLPARSLYDSLGFVPVGVRRAYYRCPVEDAVVMRMDGVNR